MEQFQTVKYTSSQYHRKLGKRQAEKNSKKSTPRHIIFKLEKKETLKETKRKDTLLQERGRDSNYTRLLFRKQKEEDGEKY